MKIEKFKCEECGGLATGINSSVFVTDEIEVETDGTARYTGGPTTVHWETKAELDEVAGIELTCQNHHVWYSKIDFELEGEEGCTT